MKTFKLFSLAVLSVLTIISCKQEETKFGASISPIQNVVSSISNLSYFRDEPTVMSTQFISTKEGRITELGIRAGKGTYVVSLWDSSAQSIITSTSITASDSTVFKYKDITDVNIEANKVYFISMFNQIAEGGTGTHVFKYGVTGFPITQGNIILQGSYYKNTANALAFPATSFSLNTSLINGIADFKYEPKL